jgi:hypothetical protein
MLESGEFYLVQARLKGELYLRCTLTNPFTRKNELKALLDRIEQVEDRAR